jgi:hypothetical protein
VLRLIALHKGTSVSLQGDNIQNKDQETFRVATTGNNADPLVFSKGYNT